MPSLYRPWIVRYVDRNGKRVPKGTRGAKRLRQRSRKWYGKGIPGQPPKKGVPLASDRTAAQLLLAQLVKDAERGGAGLGGSEVAAALKPITDHIEDYLAHLQSKDNTPEHVQLTGNRIKTICTACNFSRTGDIEADAVANYLSERRKLTRKKKGLSVASSNYYLVAIKAFCTWMTKTSPARMFKNPLDVLQAGNVKTDRHHDRRALLPEQLVKLLTATRDSTRPVCRLTGPERMMLYLVAAGTGFRAGELAELVPESFRLDADPPAVALGARDDKAGKSVAQPIHPGLAEALRAHLEGKPAGQPVWPGRWVKKGAKMMRVDLEAAGIPYAVPGPDGPLYADFHALRHSFIAMLDQAGASLKQAMQLARHSDPKLTMARYGRAQMAELGQTVQKLPALTGTQTVSALAEVPREALEALAVLGMAALAAGFFGCTPGCTNSETLEDSSEHLGTEVQHQQKTKWGVKP